MNTHRQRSIILDKAKYNQFVIHIDMLCKFAINTVLVNTKLLFLGGNTGLGSCEALVTTFLSSDQHITFGG